MNTEHTIWFEKYRPSSLDEYVGDDLLREKLAEYIATQDIPHLLFHGPAGTGKTTAAKILVNSIDCDFLFINASDERGIDTIRDKVKGFASTMGFNPLKIIVLDEMEAITPDAQRALKNLMEVYAMSTRFILTTNHIERIIDPLVSRAQTYKLLPPSKKEIARRITRILKAERIEYDTETVVNLVNTYYPDLRKIINTAQLQTKEGKLVISSEELESKNVAKFIVGILSGSTTMEYKINTIRGYLTDNKIRDFTQLYRVLYDNIDSYAGKNISQTIIAIADGQFREGQVPDKEINFMATISNILTI